MTNDRTFLRCAICGNLVEMINSSGVTPVCCGQPMNKLEPNTTDASVEKHLPVIKRDGNTVKVTIGAAIHPMTPEHYIMWIALAQGVNTKRVSLAPGDEPIVDFCVGDGPITAYAYCNLHGLWASEQYM